MNPRTILLTVLAALTSLHLFAVEGDKGAPAKQPAKAKAKAPPAQSEEGDLQPANSAPYWIWLGQPKDKQTVYFRKEFTTPAGRVTGARLYATCDNRMEIFLNDKKVAESTAWESPTFVNVGDFVNRGRNVISVKAYNEGSSAGLLVRLIVETERKGAQAVVTDATWRAAEDAAKGWTELNFNDSQWTPARAVGRLGDKPWNRITETVLAAAGMVREPTATPPSSLKVAKDFKVELLYSVPKETEGSWVAMCADDKGRLIVSDQYGPLYRVTPPALGQSGPVKVEKIDLPIGHAQGLLYAFGNLYVVVNDKTYQGRGLYRVRDTDGDDKFDKVELLKKFEEQGGEHGPHAVVLSPDGKSVYVVVGNQTALPEYNVSRVPEAWGEDLLLPRIYGRGFMKGVHAPRGWIAKTDPDGKHWDIITTGFRNQYDAAFNRHGELFTYDADMEWDVNTPWYRPTRISHVTSGSEWGWRNGSGKWPPYYPDNLPPVVDIGPGSPTGVCFGHGAKFPAKYQDAFYILDWSYGKLYAVHLEPDGSTYKASFEEFITGSPLPLTDILIHPKDQAMYFTTGGRRVQSALYRVTYTGKESTAPAKADNRNAEDRAIRHKLEAFHGVKDPKAIEAAWPYLADKDRFIRWAARTAIEHQPAAQWQEKALAEKNTQASLSALLALARMGDKSLQPRMLTALDRIGWSGLDTAQKLELLRVYALTFIRMGEPDAATKQKLIAKFDPLYPAGDRFINAEMCELLVYLQAPSTAAKTVPLLRTAPTQEEQIAYAKSLRLLRTGWTPELQRDYFTWFLRAANYRGGASFGLFIEDIKKDSIAGLTEQERAALKPIIEAVPEKKSPMEMMADALAGRAFVKEWTVEDLAPDLDKALKGGRDFERGRKMFGAVACFACHRFGQEGGTVGPDLTGAAGRFSPRDLLESTILPSKEISDQYAPVVITLNSGDTVTGRIVNLSGDKISVNTSMFDPNEQASVDSKQVKSIEPSKISMMPEGLLNMLNKDEIMNLLAYILSGGNANHAMFKK